MRAGAIKRGRFLPSDAEVRMHMKRLRFFLGAGAAIVCLQGPAHTITAQTLSPLAQVISSSTILNQPPVFRSLQTELDSIQQDVTPGVRLQILYDEMTDLRGRILALIDTPAVSLRGDSLFVVYLQDTGIVRIRSADRNLDSLLNGFELLLRTKIAGWLSLPDGLSLSRRNAILSALLDNLRRSNLADGIPPDPDASVDIQLAAAIASVIRTTCEHELFRLVPGLRKDKTGLAVAIPLINSAATDAVTSLRQKLAAVMDSAEDGVARVVDGISRWLVSGNAGVAVTKGEGVFAGGLQIGLLLSENVRIGAYVNGTFNQGDSALPSESLVGARTQAAFNLTAFDFLLAGIFADANFTRFSSGEAGIGVSRRIKDKVIAGVAYFNFFGKAYLPVHVVGLSVKAAGSGSMGLLLGAKVDTALDPSDRVSPIIQITFPVFSTQ